MAKMTEEHKKKISESCRHPKKKLYYRFFIDEHGSFQIDIATGIEAPVGYKPLTVKAIEDAQNHPRYL